MGKDTPLQLRDIHLPTPISWWPPAPGWWVLLGLLVLCFLSIFMFRRIRKRRSVRVAALKALITISSDFEAQEDTQALVKALSVLLRRICLSYFPRTEVAGLTGEAWLHFLDDCLDWQNAPGRFSSDTGRVLITAPYQPNASVDGEKLLALCSTWIHALPLLKDGSSRSLPFEKVKP